MLDNLQQNELINLLSLIIGIQNLEENREQSAHNNIQFANDKQAEQILADLHRRFEEQNAMLREILTIVKRLEEDFGNT